MHQSNLTRRRGQASVQKENQWHYTSLHQDFNSPLPSSSSSPDLIAPTDYLVQSVSSSAKLAPNNPQARAPDLSTVSRSFGDQQVSVLSEVDSGLYSSVDMPCRDRTAEFKATTKSAQMKIHANGFVQRKASKGLDASIQFNQFARKIGKDLSNTCAKLEKLTLLAKRKSLFDDRSTEIEELTHMVKQDITSLNKQIARLQQYLSEHQVGSGSKNHAQSHSKSVVVSLQSRLASVSNEFKQVLEVRTENLKEQKARRDQFSQSKPVPSSLPPSASAGHMGSVLLSDDSGGSSGEVSIAIDQLSGRDRYQQQMQLIDEQDSYIQSRASTMENIESTIVELGSIFQQLANLVHEQGEVVQRIDSHVEETGLNIEAAHTELLKYFRSISQNRWLAMKVFGVLIVFFVIFVVFMA